MVKKRHLGYAFTEEVGKIKVTSPKKGQSFLKDSESWKEALLYGYSGDPESSQTSGWLKVLLLLFFTIVFLSLFVKLFKLQILQGSRMRELADSNRIIVKIIHAPRGVIYDRNGKILAQNDPGFRLKETSNSAEVHYKQISRDEALTLESNNDPRFKDLEIDSIRSYPLGEQAAHVLGYMGEITGEELRDPNFSNYSPGDYVGKGGIENIYEKVLKGVDGGEIFEVDAEGQKVRTLRQVEAIPGQNLYLTIDEGLQIKTDQVLKEAVLKNGSCCGAAIVSDPKSGQILAMVSYPSYDPKNLTPALSDPNSPFLNRAISGTYPPGSTYKIASSLAGLSSGKITKSTVFEDTGVMNLGPYKFANWYFSEYGKTEGSVDIIKAIKRSNDVYYYHLGEMIGVGQLSETSKKLGLGKILGIDLPGEESGLIPDEKWKEKNVGQIWYPGDTLHMAIGQGYVLVTPLQILNLISTVAADGKQYPPHLALKITSPDNSLVKQFKFDGYSNSPFKSQDISLVKEGLEEVPKNGGTAWPFFTFSIPTAGKTGTAEFGDPKNSTHAWYTSYAPSNDPKIAATVLVESSGEGSNISAPVVKQIYQYYFSKDKNHLDSFELAPVATESAKILGE